MAILRDAAISAAAPASQNDESKYDGAVVQVTVTSQAAGLPACHRMRDMPSGRLPSVRQRPAGSLMSAAEKTLATTSLRACCLADLPGACLQTRLHVHAQCINLSSTATLMWHTDVEPSRMATATMNDCSTTQLLAEIGKANKQSPL